MTKTMALTGAMVIMASVWAAGALPASVLLERGIHNEQTAGRIEEAVKCYLDVIVQKDADPHLLAQAHFRLGVCRARQGDKAEAKSQFSIVVSRFPAEKKLVEDAKVQIEKLDPNGSIRPADPAGQIQVSVKVVLIESDAVPKVQAALGLDLDPATGRVVLSPKEARNTLEALLAQPSAHLVGEATMVSCAGVETTSRSTREMTYSVPDGLGKESGMHLTRELGFACTRLVESRDEGIEVTLAMDYVDVLGDQNVLKGKLPVFEDLQLATGLMFAEGQSNTLLIHGGRAELGEFPGLTLGDSLAARMSRRANDYFVFISAGSLGESRGAPRKDPVAQPMLVCRYFDLGPAAQQVVGRLRWEQGGILLSREEYAALLVELARTADAKTLASIPVVSVAKNEPTTRFLLTAATAMDGELESRDCGQSLTSMSDGIDAGGGIGFALSAELVFPAKAQGGAPVLTFHTISKSESLSIGADRTLVTPAAAPPGVLAPGHRCFIALTARVVDTARAGK